MAGRPPRANGSSYAAPAQASRTNEYFVPRDGIDREVITADICRYLGNDALVRPGTYVDEKTGQVTQGYYITAYRNLTSAMITDLKNDSARWEAERRRQSGAGAVAVRYQDSSIRDGTGRPIGGGGGGGGMPPAQAPAPYVPPSYDPRYPSNEGPGYIPVPANIPPPGPPAYIPQVAYTQPPSASATYTAPMHTMQDPRFNGQPTGPATGLGAGGYGNGGNGGSMAAPEGYVAGSFYQAMNTRDMYPQETVMEDAASMPARRTSPQGAGFVGNPGPNFRGVYNMSGGAGTYGNYGPQNPAGSGAIYAQPVDNNYGRAPNMPNPGFNTVHDVPVQQPQQYDDPAYPSSQPLPGPTATSPKTQLPSPSGPSPGPRRDRPDYRDRGVDRLPDRDPRDPRPPREPTPPNRTGSASKNGNPPHHYNRR